MCKRIIILIISLFLLACSARHIDEAQDAYQAGNYQQAIRILTNYLDKEGQLPGDKDSDRIFMLMANIIDHYKLLAENKSAYYDKRVEGYEGLLFIRQQISYKYYEPYVYALTQKYNVNDLSKDLAQQYYLWGQSIEGNSKENYRLRAELFKKSIDNYEMKDVRQLYVKNHQRYVTLEAADRYQAGKQAIARQDYKEAAENFLAAADVYQPYGKYKDSRELGIQYDKRYRKDESNRLYHQASQMAYNAYSKADYRETARLFQQAYDVYSKYGQVNDAHKQQQKYSELGMIRIYYNGDYSSLFKRLAKSDYIRYVSSAVDCDLMVTMSTEGKFYRDSDRSNSQTVSESIQQGNESYVNYQGETVYRDKFENYVFTKHTVEQRNHYVLEGRLQISGLINGTQNYYSEKSSSSIEISYTGNVPNNGKYNNHKQGKLRSEYSLRSDAQSEIEQSLQHDINALVMRLKSL